MQAMSAKITRFFARRDDDLDGLEILEAHGPHMQKQQTLDGFLVPINRTYSSPLHNGPKRERRRTAAQPPPLAAPPLIHGDDAADEREEEAERQRAQAARELREHVKREEKRERDEEDEDEDVPLIRLSRPTRPSAAATQQQPPSSLSPPHASALLATPDAQSSLRSASAGSNPLSAVVSRFKAEEDEDEPPPPAFTLVSPATMRQPPSATSQQKLGSTPLSTLSLQQSAAAMTVYHAAPFHTEAQLPVKNEEDDAMPSLRLAAFTSRRSGALPAAAAPLSPLSQNTPPRIDSAAEHVQPSAPAPASCAAVKQEVAATAVQKENNRPPSTSVAAEAAEQRRAGWRDGPAADPCSPPPLEQATQRACAPSAPASLSPLTDPLSSGDHGAVTPSAKRVKRETNTLHADRAVARGIAAPPPLSLFAVRSRAPGSLPSSRRHVALDAPFGALAELPAASSASSRSLFVPDPAHYQQAAVSPVNGDEDDGEPCSPIAEAESPPSPAAASLFAPPSGAVYTFKRLSELRGDDAAEYSNQFALQPASAAASVTAAAASSSSSSARAASSSSSSSRRRVPDFVKAQGSGHWRSINGQKVFFTPSGERLTGSAAYLRSQKLKIAAAAKGERAGGSKKKKRKTEQQRGEEQEAAGSSRQTNKKQRAKPAVSSKKKRKRSSREDKSDEDEQEDERKDAAAGRARARSEAADTVRSRSQDGKAVRAARAVDEDDSDAEAEWVPMSLQQPRCGQAAESEQVDDIEDDDDDDFV